MWFSLFDFMLVTMRIKYALKILDLVFGTQEEVIVSHTMPSM